MTSAVSLPARSRFVLLRGDHNLPEGTPSAHVREGFGHLVEPVGALDVDGDLAATHRSASGSKWGGPSLTASTLSRRPVIRPHEAGREHAQQGRHRSADAVVAAAGKQGPAVGEDRPVGDQVEDEVVAFAGEVLAAVVDYLVRADRPHEVELAGVVHARHVGTGPLGELDRERAGAASAAVDQHPPPGAGAAVPCNAIAPAWGSSMPPRRSALRACA